MSVNSRVKSVDEIIDDMKFEMAVDTDRDLADALNIDPTTISAWRRRNRVPNKYWIHIRRIENERAYESILRPSFIKLRDGYIFSLIGLCAMELKENVTLLRREEFKEIWRGFKLSDLYRYLDIEFRKVDQNKPDKLQEKYEEIREKIVSDDLCDWIETLSDQRL